MTVIYQSCKYKDDNLWQMFYEDFEGFTMEIFAQAHRQALRDLQVHLIIQGIWVKRPKGSISYARTLQDCINETIPAKWTEERTKERYKLIQSAEIPTITT